MIYYILYYNYSLCQIVSAKFVGYGDILKIVLILLYFYGIIDCQKAQFKNAFRKVFKIEIAFHIIAINLLKCWCTYEGKINLLQICKGCN